MAVTRSLDLGAYVTGEQSMLMMSTAYSGGGPVVLILPGVAGFGWDYTPREDRHPNWWKAFTLLAEAGCLVLAGTFADGADGGSSWGNLHGRDRMDLALDWLETDWGADVSRVALIGDSEGGDLALNYAWRNTVTVKACVTRLTPPDVQALYDTNGLIEALVDTAFDDLGGWAANAADHDPALNHAAIAAIEDRVRMYYSTNDGLAPEDHHLVMAEATGVEVVSVGAVDHDVTTTGPIDPYDMSGWIWERLAA